jgi:hypothetical protein
VTGGGVSGNDMPSLPWTARQDVSPAEDTPLESLLAGNGSPAGAGAELGAVADVLAALTAHPGGDELAGLTAARAEFSRRVAVPVQVRRSRRWRSFGLVSRLGVRLVAAAAIVAMGFAGAAAAAYAGALPTAWQQFAHRTIGAPVHGPIHDTRATMGAARPAPHPSSGHPAHPTPTGVPPAKHKHSHHTRPPRHAEPRTAWPFLHLFWPPIAPTEGRPLPVPRSTLLPLPTPTEPVASPSASGE